MVRSLALAAAAAIACGSGCTKTTHMTVATCSKVGVDFTAGADDVLPHAVVGYKRFEGAIVPVDPASACTDGTTCKEQCPPCPSVFSMLALRNDWLQGVKIYQAIATGCAAKAFAPKKGEAKGDGP